MILLACYNEYGWEVIVSYEKDNTSIYIYMPVYGDAFADGSV